MAEDLTKPYIGNPNLQRQAERARQLAQQRQAETLPDPRTYGFVRGLLGTPPEELGMSVLSPNTAAAKEAAYYGAQLSNLAQMAPALKPVGLLAGSAINDAMVYGAGPLASITPQPMRMIGTRFKGSGAVPTEVPGFGPAKEIQDVDSSLNIQNLQKLMDKGGSIQLSEALNHPSLYRDYPELAKYPIERLGNVWSAITNQLPSGLKGMYAEGSFYLPYQAKKVTKNAADIHSTLLHEVQHAIQQLDKMPEGSMAEQFFAKSAAKAREKVKTLKSAAYTELTNKLKDKGYEAGTIYDIMFDNKAGKELISKDKDIGPVASFYQKLQKSEYKLDRKYDEAYDKYKRTPGEAQARAVQKRFENPSEYAQPVTKSYDVPVESLYYTGLEPTIK